MRSPAAPLAALAAAAAVLAAGGLASRELLARLGAPSPPRAAGAEGARVVVVAEDAAAPRARVRIGLRVASVTGPVERRARADAGWDAVQAGETLDLHDALRTGAGGAAVLELQDHVSIWLWP